MRRTKTTGGAWTRWSPLVLTLGLAPACGDDGGGGEPTSSSSGSSSSGTSSGGATAAASTTADPSTGAVDTSTSTGSTGPGSTGPGGTSTGDPLGSSDETAIPEVSFAEVLEIIASNCSCHRGLTPTLDMDLGDDVAYDSIVRVPSIQAAGVNRVEPGDPGQSYLYRKIRDEQVEVGGVGIRMPAGAPALSPEDVDLIRFWILGGAQP